jgi:hypothetical protein
MAAATEERKAEMRAYHARVKDERNAKKRAERAADPEAVRAAARAYYDRTKDATRERQRAASRASLSRLRRDVLDGYGGACACCGSDYYSHLTLVHVEGGGRQERIALGGGQAIYRRLRRESYPPGYQILCFNCNAAKHTLGRCGCSDEEG